MSDAAVVILLVGAATVALKAAGPVFVGGGDLPARLTGAVGLLAPAVLSALIAVQVFGGDRQLELDERALGLLAAVSAAALRAPVLVVVVAAAAVTAGARLLG